MKSRIVVMVMWGLASAAWAEGSPTDECPKFERIQVPAADQPSAAERESFKSAQRECWDYLYGFGVAKDPVKARKCCLAKEGCNTDLAMIYANGWGVKRNLDLAAHFVCAAEELAPAEADGMLGALQEMRGTATPGELSFCSFVTSGLGMSSCARLDEKQQAQKNEARLAALEKGWDAATRKGFSELKQAAGKFFEAEAALSSDESRGGSIQGSEHVGTRSALHKRFVEEVERANTQPTLSATEEALKQADAELNTLYKAKLAEGDETARKYLKDAQRAWIPYRDAWVRFQQARWSAGVDGKKLSTELLTRLTRERVAALKELNPTNAEN